MPDNKERVVVNVSLRTIVSFFVVLIGIVLLYIIRDIIVLFFIVLIMVAALNPIVDRWQKDMPRSLAVGFLYLIIFLVLIAAGVLIVPPLVEQVQQFANDLPDFLRSLFPIFQSLRNVTSESQKALLSISQQLSQFGGNIVSTTLGFLGGVVAAFTIFVMSFYMLLEKEGAKKFFLSIFPSEQKEEIVETINKIGLKMGAWLRGQLALMLIIGVLDLVILLVLRVPFSLALAVWAGLTEVIPYIGPWLGLIPAVIIAFTVSPLTALIVFILYVAVQQIEAQFLVPKVMEKAVGLSPVVVILALLIGAKLAGLLGVIIAVPAAAALSVVVQEYPRLKEAFDKK